jgi:hypothetical protein
MCREAGIWQTCPPVGGCICSGSAQRPLLDLEQAWSRIAPLIVCISLLERDDRFRKACLEMHAIGLCRLVRFYRPSKPDPNVAKQLNVKAGHMGCFNSHSEVARHTIRWGAERCLVFEDDVQFVRSRMSPAALQNVYTVMKEHAGQWDELLLGHFPMIGRPVSADVFYTRSVCTHAYVLTAAAAAKLAITSYVENKKRVGYDEALDWWMMKNYSQLAIRPMLCVQSSSDSDVQSSALPHWLDTALTPAAFSVLRNFPAVIEVTIYFLLPIVIALLALLLLVAMLYVMYRLSGTTSPGLEEAEQEEEKEPPLVVVNG